MENKQLFLLALNRITPLTPRERLALWELYGGTSGSSAGIFKLSRSGLAQVLGRRILRDWWQPEMFIRQAEADLEQAARGRLQFVTYADADYPPHLKNIFDPPLVLYYRGRLPGWQERMIGIVGTRHPTGAACVAAFRLAWNLSREGIGVVSGLARGIDSEAHAGSLEGKGVCLAVLGNGIDSIYPVTSRPLARKILEKGGAILSEYPPETPPLKYNFPGRNRIISGLSQTVVVVQAPVRSGALITADYALEQGRELVVHKAGLAGQAGAGTRRLYTEGAEAIGTAEELLAKGAAADPGRPAGCPENPAPGAFITADYLTKNLDFVNLKEAGLILAKMMEKELKGELKKSYGKFLAADITVRADCSAARVTGCNPDNTGEGKEAEV